MVSPVVSSGCSARPTAAPSVGGRVLSESPGMGQSCPRPGPNRRSVAEAGPTGGAGTTCPLASAARCATALPGCETDAVTVSHSWDMPLRTKLLARALSRSRSAERMQTADEIARSRAWFAPARVPFTWITGSVPAGVEIGSTSFRARDGHEVAVRTYRPRHAESEALPAMLWFHGGGWVLGNTRGYDPLCAWIADRARVAVLNVDYRLAPEHRAPRAAHDCVDAARWAASDASGGGIRHSGLGLAGDSAGGNLAAVTAQVLRADGGAEIAYQALVYPAVDATMSSPSVAEHAQAPILTRG